MRTSFQAACAALTLACCWASTGFTAEKVRVEIETGAAGASDAGLRDASGDDSLFVVQRGARTIVETDVAGYKKLLANPNLHSVRIVGPSPLDDSGPVTARRAKPTRLNFRSA